ncbi:hypothetical protein BU15DRAFT_63561 [Melanogaster broomeanus]|nr:hypothetical protein BU15DRAFT_63561 [Melanogaster broomeanus]
MYILAPSDDEQSDKSDKSDNDGHLPPSSPPPLPSEDEGNNTEDYDAVENAVAGDLDNSGPEEEAMDDEQGSDGPQCEAWELDPSSSNYSSDVRWKKKAGGTGAFSPEAEEDDQREVDDRQALTKPSHRKKASKQTIKAGAKRHRKSTALLSDIDVSEREGDDITLENDEDDKLDGGEGVKVRSGPLSQAAQVECEALGKEIKEKVKALAVRYHKSPRVILKNAALVTGFMRKESLWNIHQSWFCATQSKDDEDAADVKQRQKDEYMQIKNLPDDAPQWVPTLKYWKEMHNTIDTGPKTAAGRVMCIHDLFSKSARAIGCTQGVHVFGFSIYTGDEEGGHQAVGMWSGSDVVCRVIEAHTVDLQKMIDWWTTCIKYVSMSQTAGPFMPLVPNGTAEGNPMWYLCKPGESERDRNRRCLTKMILGLLVETGYMKKAVHWKELTRIADKLHFTIMNWPDGVPVPDDQFDYHALHPKLLRKLLGSHLHWQLGDIWLRQRKKRGKSKSKGKGKGKVKQVDDDNDDNDFYLPPSNNDIYFHSWDESTSLYYCIKIRKKEAYARYGPWGTMEIAKGIACKTDKENNRELLFYETGLDRRRKIWVKAGDPMLIQIKERNDCIKSAEDIPLVIPYSVNRIGRQALVTRKDLLQEPEVEVPPPNLAVHIDLDDDENRPVAQPCYRDQEPQTSHPQLTQKQDQHSHQYARREPTPLPSRIAPPLPFRDSHHHSKAPTHDSHVCRSRVPSHKVHTWHSRPPSRNVAAHLHCRPARSPEVEVMDDNSHPGASKRSRSPSYDSRHHDYYHKQGFRDGEYDSHSYPPSSADNASDMSDSWVMEPPAAKCKKGYNHHSPPPVSQQTAGPSRELSRKQHDGPSQQRTKHRKDGRGFSK